MSCSLNLPLRTRLRAHRLAPARGSDVCGGSPLSEALARWPQVFPGVMVSLLRAAELSGTTALMLARVSDYLSKELRTKRQVRGAMLYPGFMLGSGLLVVAFLVTFILPRFARIYEMRSASLPASSASW